jgi:ribosomal protein L9
VEEFTKIKARMAQLEKQLTKASELAANLQPIEMPSKEGEDTQIPPNIGRRIKALERLVAGGANPEMVKELEDKLDNLKSKLGGQLSDERKVQLDALEKKIEDKMARIELIKDDMVESTIEQLLAQPANVNRLVDKKISRQLTDLNNKVDKMDKMVSPADAKLRLVIKDIEDRERELDALKRSMKEMQSKYKEDLESLEIELKTMTSRMGSVHTSVKSMEGAKTPDLMRDLEILKTKAEWLESTVQKFNLKPIYERLQELEEKIRTSHGYSPIVIE